MAVNIRSSAPESWAQMTNRLEIMLELLDINYTDIYDNRISQRTVAKKRRVISRCEENIEKITQYYLRKPPNSVERKQGRWLYSQWKDTKDTATRQLEYVEAYVAQVQLSALEEQ